MAWTNVGFDGTINEAQWASLAGLLGNDYVAAGNGDCVVTAVPGTRSVSVAAGSLYGHGVLSTNSGPETVAMTTPVNGQWYVIALRRTWATNTAALVAIAGATTTTTTPTAPPTSFPTLNTNKGVLTDQPIAWAWCNSANTTVVVYDIRLRAVKSLPPVVANANERDAKFMSPTQGLQVWRDDLGAVETYFGLYNASTNPGGRDAAGWYVDNRASGLVPLRASTVTISSGTGSTNSLGQITFSNATNVALDGIFSTNYRYYKVIYDYVGTTNDALLFRFRTGGTTNTTNNYYAGGLRVDYGASLVTFASNASASFTINETSASIFRSSGTLEVQSPMFADWTVLNGNAFDGWRLGMITSSAAFTQGTLFDGFNILPASGNITGKIQVFGYND
jgi:hypothetical protein